MGLIAVKDEVNNDWILQNQETGDIIRFSFNNEKPTTKSSFPTLVDLKITDHCTFGCTMCYQSSTTQGKHANAFPTYEQEKNGDISINYIADALRKMNVLEVVLGGGEPTQHPDIVKILKTFKDKDFVVGITTKNYSLGSHEKFKEIIENIDTMAISCNSATEVERAKMLFDDIFSLNTLHKVKIPEIYIQNILGLTSIEKLKEFLESCKTFDFKNVTLLGYKDFGFGEKINPKEIGEEWIDLVKESNLNIGVDSVLVATWKEKLLEKGIRKEFLVEGEGKFSMYIDAVEKKMASSSFTKKTFDIPKKDWGSNLAEKMLEIFRYF